MVLEWEKVVDFGVPDHFQGDEERKVRVMSLGLKGEYSHSIDSKGRMIVPSKLREQLGVSFVIARGMDRCLCAYPREEWEIYAKKLEELPTTSKNARRFVRAISSSAYDCEVDNQGRINIPQKLRDFAQITKDVVVVGVGDKAEIWSKELYEAECCLDDVDLDELASGFADLGFNI